MYKKKINITKKINNKKKLLSKKLFYGKYSENIY